MTTIGPYDEIPFRYDAKSPTTAVELEKGDLLISGWALRFDEIDWEGERWNGLSDRLWHSLKRFVDRKGPLAYQHQGDTVGIGRVIECERVPGVGVRVKAVLGYQEPGTKWRHIYEAARKSYLPRFSLGGLFMRRQGPDGPVLEDAEFNELSICGSSIGKGTTWNLIAQKALTCPDGKAITSSGEIVDGTSQLLEIKAQLGQLKQALGGTEMWRRNSEATPNATVIYADDEDRVRDHERKLKAQADNRRSRDLNESILRDTGLPVVAEAEDTHEVFGVKPAVDPNGVREFEVDGGTLQALYGVADVPRDPKNDPEPSALDTFNARPSVLENVKAGLDAALKRKEQS